MVRYRRRLPLHLYWVRMTLEKSLRDRRLISGPGKGSRTESLENTKWTGREERRLLKEKSLVKTEKKGG